MVNRLTPQQMQIIRQQQLRQQQIQRARIHPFWEAMDDAGKVLDSLGNDSWDMV